MKDRKVCIYDTEQSPEGIAARTQCTAAWLQLGCGVRARNMLLRSVYTRHKLR